MDDIMNGIQTYRNPKLVHILDKLNFIENYGTGIPRIISAYNSSDKKPTFFSSESFFIVHLPNLNYFCSQNEQINDFNSEILNLIEKYPGIKVPDIVNKLNQNGYSVTSVKVRNEIKRNLKKYIEYKGSNKTGGYYIKNKNGI